VKDEPERNVGEHAPEIRERVKSLPLLPFIPVIYAHAAHVNVSIRWTGLCSGPKRRV